MNHSKKTKAMNGEKEVSQTKEDGVSKMVELVSHGGCKSNLDEAYANLSEDEKELVFTVSPRIVYDKRSGAATLMHLAAVANNVEALKWLQDNYVRYGCDAAGRTPLHIAAMFGSTDVARWLLDTRGPARISTPDNRSRTPLYLAVRHRHPSMVQLLLHCGAMPTGKECSQLVDMLLDSQNQHTSIEILQILQKDYTMYRTSNWFDRCTVPARFADAAQPFIDWMREELHAKVKSVDEALTISDLKVTQLREAGKYQFATSIEAFRRSDERYCP